MNFYFWQNTNSIHQAAFLEELALSEDHKVILIVTEKLSDDRQKMGWSEPSLSHVKLLYAYDIESLPLYLLEENNSNDLHVFSGIEAFKRVHIAFKKAISKRCRVAIFTEPLDDRGWKGKLRILRGYWHRLRYNKSIDFILPTGEKGVEQFERWGYSSKKIYEWAYTMEESNVSLKTNSIEVEEPFKIMFAGSLIHRKGYDLLLDAVGQINSLPFRLDLFAASSHNKELINNLKVKLENEGLQNKVNFYPFLKNAELRNAMNNYDLFVLPSRHDGWGAVVSESVMEGTPVVVSDRCGSSTLVRNEIIGSVIKPDANELATKLKFHIMNGSVGLKKRLRIREWAKKNISGYSMSCYFIEIVTFQLKQNQKRPTQPWLKK